MLAHVNDAELNDVPRVGPLRRKILKDATAFFEQIPLQSGYSDEVRLRVAETWGQISDIGWQLNEVEQSRRAYATSLAALESLRAEHPDSSHYKARTAGFYEKAQWLYGDDFDQAAKLLRKAADLYSELGTNEPQENSWLIRQAATLGQLAHFSERQWRARRGSRLFRASN